MSSAGFYYLNAAVVSAYEKKQLVYLAFLIASHVRPK